MSVEVPRSLLGVADKALVETSYFVIRVLRNVNRGYGTTLVSTEMSPEVRDLAQRVISEIAQQENSRIVDLDVQRREEYISSLEELQRSRYLHAVGNDADRAADVLDQLRSSDD